MPRPMSRRVRALAAAVALALLAALILAADPRAVGASLRGARPGWLALACLASMAQLPVMSTRWWLLLRAAGERARWSDLLRANAGVNLLNFALPGHVGEPLAAGWLARRGLAAGLPAFGSLLAGKVIGMTLQLLVAAVTLPWLATRAGASTGALVALLGGLGLAAALAGAALVAEPVATWGLSLLARALRGALPGPAAQIVPGGLRLRGSLLQALTTPRALGVALALSLVKMGLSALSLAWAFRALGIAVAPLPAAFLQAIDALSTLASSWAPGNLGLHDALLAAASGLGLRLPAGVAVAGALVAHAVWAIHVVVAGAIALALPPVSPTRPTPAASDGPSAAPGGSAR